MLTRSGWRHAKKHESVLQAKRQVNSAEEAESHWVSKNPGKICRPVKVKSAVDRGEFCIDQRPGDLSGGILQKGANHRDRNQLRQALERNGESPKRRSPHAQYHSKENSAPDQSHRKQAAIRGDSDLAPQTSDNGEDR